MKKLLLLFFIPFFLFAVDCNRCVDNGGYWRDTGEAPRDLQYCDTYTPVSGLGVPVEQADCPSKLNFNDMCTYDGGVDHYRVIDKIVVDINIPYQTENHGEYYDFPAEHYVMRQTKNLECVTCDEPDQSLVVPSGYTISDIDLVDSSQHGGCPMQDPLKVQECSDAAGMVVSGLQDCCSVFACVVPNTPPPQCSPTQVPDQFGPGCHCPPDTFPIPVTPSGGGDPYVVCLPNADCDWDKGQIYTPDGCVCPYDMEPDNNGTCLPTAPDNNNTPPLCPPGQHDCFGTCQLNAVDCTPPSGDGDGGGAPPNCNYPLWSPQHSYIYQTTSPSDLSCSGIAHIHGTNMPYEFYKLDTCPYGGCYFPDTVPVPDDNNSDGNGGNGGNDDNNSGGGTGTGAGDFNTSDLLDQLNANGDKLDKIDASINRNADKLSTINHSINQNGNKIDNASSDIRNTLNSLNDSLGNKLDKIDNTIKNKSLLGSLSTLGSKLDSIKGAINDKNLSQAFGSGKEFVPLDTNISNFTVSDDRMKSFNNKLSDFYEKLGSATDLMETIKNEFESFSENIQVIWTQLNTDFTTYKDMFENKPTVTISSGSCDLTASVLGRSLDLGTSLCSGMQKMSPFFVFIITVASQLSIVYMSLWLIKKD